jgi:hypothetical protein
MDVRITPRPLSGTVSVPPSKSMAHRLAIAAALAEGVSTLENVALSQDVEATLRCLAALGGQWEQTAPGTVRITGCGGRRTAPAAGAPLPRFDCGESGSTLRFLSAHRPGAAGRRRLYRPGAADGAAPGPLRRPLSGKGDLLGAAGRRPHRPGNGWPRGSTACRATSPVSFSPGCSLPCPCWTGPAPSSPPPRWRAGTTFS